MYIVCIFIEFFSTLFELFPYNYICITKSWTKFFMYLYSQPFVLFICVFFRRNVGHRHSTYIIYTYIYDYIIPTITVLCTKGAVQILICVRSKIKMREPVFFSLKIKCDFNNQKFYLRVYYSKPQIFLIELN